MAMRALLTSAKPSSVAAAASAPLDDRLPPSRCSLPRSQLLSSHVGPCKVTRKGPDGGKERTGGVKGLMIFRKGIRPAMEHKGEDGKPLTTHRLRSDQNSIRSEPLRSRPPASREALHCARVRPLSAACASLALSHPFACALCHALGFSTPQLPRKLTTGRRRGRL